MRARNCGWSQPWLMVTRIEDDPDDTERVILTDTTGNRHNVRVDGIAPLLAFADGIDLSETTRIGWDG